MREQTKFYLDSRFWLGIVLGSIIVTLVGFAPSIISFVGGHLNPMTIDDCKYGLHMDFFGTSCVNDSEMKDIVGCSNTESLNLRDGYWWECK